MATKKTSKRKRVVLSMNQKAEVVQMLNDGCSLTVIAEKYNIRKSPVSDIRKHKEKIREFISKTADMGISRETKVMKLGSDAKLDEAVFNLVFSKKIRRGPGVWAIASGKSCSATQKVGSRQFCGKLWLAVKLLPEIWHSQHLTSRREIIC